MMKKISIIWASGSWKSTIANMISLRNAIILYELDDFYWKSKYTIKEMEDKRKDNIDDIILYPSRIIEWVYIWEWVNNTFEQADIIIYCYASKIHLLTRLVNRERKKWKKIKEIIWLIKYSLNYKNKTEGLFTMLKKYDSKVMYLDTSNKKAVINLMNKI